METKSLEVEDSWDLQTLIKLFLGSTEVENIRHLRPQRRKDDGFWEKAKGRRWSRWMETLRRGLERRCQVENSLCKKQNPRRGEMISYPSFVALTSCLPWSRQAELGALVQCPHGTSHSPCLSTLPHDCCDLPPRLSVMLCEGSVWYP